MQGVEKALEPDKVANHPEDAQEPHHPHRPHNLAGLLISTDHNLANLTNLSPARLSSCSRVRQG